ncbi:hypothetical protein [Halorarius litoreus]|uniref:hypothetical protein n=1 Tax=Halorarius litoreus TaxID=2962676 RepID=UPI0020CE2733|nr:hypothetical protein [Halorarius litoreus]
MYTGQTERPCCLCGNPETTTRLDLPPRAAQLLKNSESIAWRDIEGEVSIHFCESDWATVRDLVLDTGMSPLPRCNTAQASFVLREDFEALLNDVRDEPDQTPLEREMHEDAKRVVETHGSDPYVSDRDLVEARVVLDAFDRLGVTEATSLSATE